MAHIENQNFDQDLMEKIVHVKDSLQNYSVVSLYGQNDNTHFTEQ